MAAMEDQEKEVKEKKQDIICKVGRFYIFYYRANQVKEGLDQLVRVGEMKQNKK